MGQWRPMDVAGGWKMEDRWTSLILGCADCRYAVWRDVAVFSIGASWLLCVRAREKREIWSHLPREAARKKSPA
jgi:hypothetical protein